MSKQKPKFKVGQVVAHEPHIGTLFLKVEKVMWYGNVRRTESGCTIAGFQYILENIEDWIGEFKIRKLTKTEAGR